MTTAAVTWHKRKYPYEGYEARRAGEVIASVERREGTPSGYWGAWKGRITGRKGAVYPATLREFKQDLARYLEREATS